VKELFSEPVADADGLLADVLLPPPGDGLAAWPAADLEARVLVACRVPVVLVREVAPPPGVTVNVPALPAPVVNVAAPPAAVNVAAPPALAGRGRAGGGRAGVVPLRLSGRGAVAKAPPGRCAAGGHGRGAGADADAVRRRRAKRVS
jgi:hypothetical protein